MTDSGKIYEELHSKMLYIHCLAVMECLYHVYLIVSILNVILHSSNLADALLQSDLQ